MKNIIFSHDHFNTWTSCRQKYYFKYLKELKTPEFHNDYELGKSLHALIDYKLRGFNIQPLLKDCDKEILTLWNSIKDNPVMNKKLISTELSFNTRIKDTNSWLMGRIDAIFFDEKQNKFIIADWKTGKIVPKDIYKTFQHKIYLYAFYKSQKDLGLEFTPEDLVFQYFKIIPDAVEITEIKYSLEVMAEYEKIFLKILQEIENFSGETSSTAKICSVKTCPYLYICIK